MEIYLSEEDRKLANTICNLRMKDLLLDEEPMDKAFEILYDLCFNAPERAANIVLFIGLHCENDWVIDLITSGPLEITLIHHGEKVIDQFLNAAKFSPVIKEMLCGAVLFRAPENIQKKVDDICGAGENSAT